MNRSKLFSVTTLWYLTLAVALSFVIPIIFIEINASDIQRLGLILFGINVIYSLVVGVIVGLKQQPLVNLLFFPIVYLIGVYFFFDSYAYYFAGAYIIFAFLAYGTVRK